VPLQCKICIRAATPLDASREVVLIGNAGLRLLHSSLQLPQCSRGIWGGGRGVVELVSLRKALHLTHDLLGELVIKGLGYDLWVLADLKLEGGKVQLQDDVLASHGCEVFGDGHIFEQLKGGKGGSVGWAHKSASKKRCSRRRN